MGTRSKEREAGRKLRKATPEQRREALEAFRRSGLSQVLFARQWGVHPTTFSGWVGRYAREGAKGLEPGAGIAKDRRGRRPWLSGAVEQAVAAAKRRFPAFGLRRIKDFLRRFSGLAVSTGSVRRVLAAEGLATAPPARGKRRRRRPVGPPTRFERAHANDLWQSDITYVDAPWSRKPLYLVAFLDDASRYVVAFGLHAHQRGEIVLEALAEGISRYGRPKEVLTDQGRQYYAWRGKTDFQKRLKREGIQHVVARAHHPETVGKCERLWKTLQDELWGRVHLADLEDARRRLKHWVEHYNFQRPHQSLEGQTPADRFFGAKEAVERAVEQAVERNAVRLALGEAPRRPVYLVGQIDGQVVSLHGEGGRIVVQTPDGRVSEIESKDLGAAAGAAAPAGGSGQPKQEVADGDDDEHGDDPEEPGAGAGGPGPQGPAGGAQAAEVRGAGEAAAAGAGAVAGGERGGAPGGAPDGGGGAVDVAGPGAP